MSKATLALMVILGGCDASKRDTPASSSPPSASVAPSVAPPTAGGFGGPGRGSVDEGAAPSGEGCPPRSIVEAAKINDGDYRFGFTFDVIEASYATVVMSQEKETLLVMLANHPVAEPADGTTLVALRTERPGSAFVRLDFGFPRGAVVTTGEAPLKKTPDREEQKAPAFEAMITHTVLEELNHGGRPVAPGIEMRWLMTGLVPSPSGEIELVPDARATGGGKLTRAKDGWACGEFDASGTNGHFKGAFRAKLLPYRARY